MHLGLTSEEFWSLTPRLFVLLAQAKRVEVMRQEFGPAIVACWVAALGGQKRRPQEFMPSMRGMRPRKQSWQEQLAAIRVLHAGMGGADGADRR